MTRTNAARLAILGVLLALGVAPAAAGETDVTTVILVRHAEKTTQAEDPPLSPAGRERAATLARVLADSAPTALFCSQYRRTHDTLVPLSERLGLAIREYAIRDVAEASRGLARLILSEHRGGVVVVAGHSNTVPVLLDALGAGPAPEIDDGEYDDLFVVTVRGSDARLLRLHYGAATP